MSLSEIIGWQQTAFLTHQALCCKIEWKSGTQIKGQRGQPYSLFICNILFSLTWDKKPKAKAYSGTFQLHLST